jgi:uncharacterized membrane protein
MNEEAAVVMAFFTFRVFLVGTIFFVFPRISRKGLMFGTYLGEDRAEGSARRQLLRTWDRGCALILVVSLIVGWSIGLSGRWIPGNLIGTAVLLLSFIPLYIETHRKALRFASPDAVRQASRSSATLQVDETRGDRFATLALALCIVAALALVTHATLAFQAMPDRIPTLGSLFGYGEELTDKSLVTVLLVPSFNLVFAPFFALMALLVARAKRSVRGGSGGRSDQAQDRFRVAMSHVFAGWGLSTCLFLGVASWEMIQVWQGRAESLGLMIGWVAGAIVLYMGVSLVRIMILGQGGARLESGSAEAPLTGGLADNARWILGVMYVNPTDPAVMVETRFGIGYTMNLGNRVAQVLLTVYLLALLGLTFLTLMAFRVF